MWSPWIVLQLVQLELKGKLTVIPFDNMSVSFFTLGLFDEPKNYFFYDDIYTLSFSIPPYPLLLFRYTIHRTDITSWGSLEVTPRTIWDTRTYSLKIPPTGVCSNRSTHQTSSTLCPLYISPTQGQWSHRFYCVWRVLNRLQKPPSPPFTPLPHVETKDVRYLNLFLSNFCKGDTNLVVVMWTYCLIPEPNIHCLREQFS